MREALIEVVLEKRSHFGWETYAKLVAARLLLPDADGYKPTPAGKELAALEIGKAEIAKKKRNASARARSSAMSGIGMKRNRSGGWE